MIKIKLLFPFIATLIFLGGCERKQAPFNEVAEEMSELLEGVQAEESLEAQNARIGKTMELVNEAFDTVVSTTEGDQKIVMAIGQKHMKEIASLGLKWNESFDAMCADEILDVTFFDDTEEMDRQMLILGAHVKVTKEYEVCMFTASDRIEKEMHAAVGEKCVHASEFIAGLRESLQKTKPVLRKLLKSHVSYGETGAGIITLLKKNPEAWTLNDEIEFKKPEIEKEFDRLFDELTTAGDRINSLVELLAKEAQKNL